MNNLKKLLFRAVLAVSLVAPTLSSCSEFDEIWNKIDSIEAQLDSIQNDLNAQVEALSALMTDGSTISSCTKKDDGSYVVKLSNGTEFTVLPAGADFSALVSTYTDKDGAKYWATYDPNGDLVPLKDPSGKLIPISDSVKVELIDGAYYLIVNGEKYLTGYDDKDVVSVFSSCKPLTDASGNVYAMTFTFGDGQKVTVAVDGYKGVIFNLSNAGTLSAVSEYYVDYGKTMRFLMDVEGVIDYVMQIPDGWRVNEVLDELTGDTYVDITAPVKSVIDAGAAVAKGDLKVVSVVEGGKAAVTKLSLSTDPFKVYNVSPVKAVIEPTDGIQKFLYGLADLATFDETQLVAQVNDILKSSNDLPKGFNLSESAIDKTLAEIYGAEIPEGANLMFWAIPALYTEGDKEVAGGYYVKEEMLRTLMLAPVFVKMEVSGITVLDANLKVDVKGATKMYAGTSLKSASTLEEIVYQINNEIIEPVSQNLSYNGPASEFPSKDDAVSMEPATAYVSWVVPVEDGKKEYLASDVIYKEFTTLSVQAGGTIEIKVGDFTTDCSYISAPVSSENAAMLYYAWLSDSEGKRISQADNESKMNKLLSTENFTVIRGTAGTAEVDFIKPETTMWLFAVAVGHDGKYGEVFCKSVATKAVSFNSLAVSIAEPEVSAKDAIFKVSVSGGTASDYIYWCGKETDPFWLYEDFCNKSLEGAEAYMAANPDAEAIQTVMRKNGKVASDGTVTISELEVSTTYVFVVLAKDAEGNYSKGAMKKFNTDAVDLGDEFVAEGTDKWNEVKTWIENNIVWDKSQFKASASSQGFASYAFSIKTPTDLTAYISCFATQATEMADQILELEQFCSSSRDVSLDVPDPEGLDWIDDQGKEHSAAIYFNVYDAYVHGVTTYGYVTYFPSTGHNETNCPVWNNGECSTYAQKEKVMAEKLSLDHWKEWINETCNYLYQGDPNHKYSYTLTDEAKINALAQALLDAYTPYYKDRKPIVYVNDGSALKIVNREAMGIDDTGNVVDKVTVLLKDANGNYYAPMVIQVPNYFK